MEVSAAATEAVWEVVLEAVSAVVSEDSVEPEDLEAAVSAPLAAAEASSEEAEEVSSEAVVVAPEAAASEFRLTPRRHL